MSLHFKQNIMLFCDLAICLYGSLATFISKKPLVEFDLNALPSRINRKYSLNTKVDTVFRFCAK